MDINSIPSIYYSASSHIYNPLYVTMTFFQGLVNDFYFTQFKIQFISGFDFSNLFIVCIIYMGSYFVR